MRLEWYNEDKVIVTYRVEFQTYESGPWNFVGHDKSLKKAQQRVFEFARISRKTTKIRIVKYTQTIEILETTNGVDEETKHGCDTLQTADK